MDYDYLKLNTRDFEHLVQALTQNLLGNNSLVFGDGPDGARELTHRGKCSFPNIDNPWDGYWIVQAKFKARQFNQEDDFEWVKQNFIAEMKKFENKSTNFKKHNHLAYTF